MPKITVYFLQASRSIRPVWLLEELNLPYEVEFSDRVKQKAPDDFKQKSGNPLGKFPTVKDGDLVLTESGNIIEYLCETYDKSNKLMPQDAYLRNKVRMWVHAAEGTFMIHGLAVLYATWTFPEDLKKSNPEALKQIEASLSVNVQKDMDWLESELKSSTGQFLVGNQVTAADIMMQFSARFIIERKLGTGDKTWPTVTEWLERCENTGSYKRAVEKSGHTLYPETI